MEIAYTVERTISDKEFSEMYVENRRQDIRKRLIDQGVTNPSDEKVERMVKMELKEVAKDMLLESQGHNDLHRDIEIGSVSE